MRKDETEAVRTVIIMNVKEQDNKKMVGYKNYMQFDGVQVDVEDE